MIVCSYSAHSSISSSSEVSELSEPWACSSSGLFAASLRLAASLVINRSASASNAQVSIEEGKQNSATLKKDVAAHMNLVYHGIGPSGPPCPVSIMIARYVVAGIDSKSAEVLSWT